MRAIDALLACLIGLAILAALVSANAATSDAIRAAASAMAKAVTTLMQPASGR